mgnify:CR=1 FL=1
MRIVKKMKNKEIKLVLTGKPLSTNHIYKMSCLGGVPRYYMTKEGKQRKIDYQWQINQQYKGQPIKEEVEMDVRIFFGDKRKNDYDNFGKILNDSLIGQVLVDDSQIKKATIILDYDKQNPKIELTIKKYETT